MKFPEIRSRNFGEPMEPFFLKKKRNEHSVDQLQAFDCVARCAA
jgi:hypothetical protein